jgi:hypothetical protein
MRLPEILEAMNVADDTRETAVFWTIQLGPNSSYSTYFARSRQEKANEARSQPHQHLARPADIWKTFHSAV